MTSLSVFEKVPASVEMKRGADEEVLEEEEEVSDPSDMEEEYTDDEDEE